MSTHGLARPLNERDEVENSGAPEPVRREFNVRQVRLVSVWLALANLIFWPLDVPLLGAHPHELRAFAAGRVVIFGLLGGLYVAVRVSSFVRVQIVPVAFLFSCAFAFVVAAMFAELGGFDRPWFHFAYIAPFLPTLHWLDRRTRVVAPILIPLAFLLGYTVAHPHYLRASDGGLALGYMVFTMGLGIVAGRESDRLRNLEYHLRRRLAQQAAELEYRVDLQTHELRSLALHLDAAQENERTRIARELHDELGQELTAMRYALKLFSLRSEGHPEGRDELENLHQLVDRISDTLRGILTDLRPRVLDDFGLDAAIEWLAQRTQQRTGIPCHVALSGFEEPVPNDIAWAVFRIVQESLTNAARHASTPVIHLLLRREPGSLLVEVTDEGVGLAHPPEQASGMGLLGMRERSRALRGQLTIVPGPHGGTTVRLRVPLEATTASDVSPSGAPPQPSAP